MANKCDGVGQPAPGWVSSAFLMMPGGGIEPRRPCPTL